MTPIKLHDLKPAPGSKTAKTRVGRGEGSKGKTAGRGTKGTKARKNVPATFEGGQMPIHMRLPKLKGFRSRFRTEYEVVNVADLNKLFPKGGDVGVDELDARPRRDHGDGCEQQGDDDEHDGGDRATAAAAFARRRARGIRAFDRLRRDRHGPQRGVLGFELRDPGFEFRRPCIRHIRPLLVET